jgi:hypothetical protein
MLNMMWTDLQLPGNNHEAEDLPGIRVDHNQFDNVLEYS